MVSNVCAAPDCDEPITDMSAGGTKKYCSARCRSRHYWQRVRAYRREQSRCTHCGDKLSITTKTMHCERCKKYWRDRYEASINKSADEESKVH